MSICPVITCVSVAGRAAGRGRLWPSRQAPVRTPPRCCSSSSLRSNTRWCGLRGRVLDRLDRRVRAAHTSKRSPVPVNAGSRMRTGAPRWNARIAPATPTPPPRSAEPEITAWMVSPAPCVPNASIFRLCFLKMPASSPSVGAWFSQLLIWPDRDLQRVLCGSLRRAERERDQRPSDPQQSHFLPPLFFFAPRLAPAAAAFAGAGSRAAASAARSIGSDFPRPSRSANRRTQYS